MPRPGSTEHYDKKLGASWCYDPASQLYVSYDTRDVALQKVEYIKDHGFGGAMWWESSGDKPGEDSLINTVYVGMQNCDGRGIERSNNQLEYPESKFENLKKGFPGEN